MSHSFRRFEQPVTATERAVDLARHTLAQYQALKDGLDARLKAEGTVTLTDAESADIDRQMNEWMTTIATLLQGRHRDAVLPLVRETWPQLAPVADQLTLTCEGCKKAIPVNDLQWFSNDFGVAAPFHKRCGMLLPEHFYPALRSEIEDALERLQQRG